MGPEGLQQVHIVNIIWQYIFVLHTKANLLDGALLTERTKM